jgi:two-component sensor histidine kinase
MKYFLTLLFLTLFSSVGAQTDFILNGKTVRIDSVFAKKKIALSHYNDNIDSAILVANSNVQRNTLIYIKAVKLFSDNKWKESNQLLKFCIAHPDSMNILARIKIEMFYGSNLVLLGAVTEGMDRLAKVDSTAEALNNPTLIINVKNFYAEANRNIGRLDRAKEILETGAKYVDKAGWPARLSYTLSMVTTLNQLAVNKNDVSLAIRANSITEPILHDPALKNADKMLYGYMLAEKGASLSIMKKHTEAIGFFMDAREVFLPIFPEGAFNQEINIFHEYVNLKDYKKVIVLGENLLPGFDEFRELAERKIEIYQRLSDAYEETGNSTMALRYTHLLITEKENADQIRYSKDLADLDERYKNSKIEEEVRIANIEKKASDKTAREKANLLTYAIAACVVFAILLVVAVVLALQFNLAKKRILQQTSALENKNMELDKAIKEKDFLFKELHHRVKNNIQLIISFMKLQYKYSPQMSLDAFMVEIENKMNAMTLVHEKLYKEQTNELIDLKDYVQDIADYLLDSDAQVTLYPEVKLHGPSIKIHIDKAIPIGLIMNEALTNSIKHGFNPQIPHPQVDIRFDRTGNHLQIIIEDNGIGFPKGFDPEKTNTLGTKAILLLAKQIHAHTSWLNQQGAQWKLRVPVND